MFEPSPAFWHVHKRVPNFTRTNRQPESLIFLGYIGTIVGNSSPPINFNCKAIKKLISFEAAGFCLKQCRKSPVRFPPVIKVIKKFRTKRNFLKLGRSPGILFFRITHIVPGIHNIFVILLQSRPLSFTRFVHSSRLQFSNCSSE